jgi:hypothetical protein
LNCRSSSGGRDDDEEEGEEGWRRPQAWKGQAPSCKKGETDVGGRWVPYGTEAKVKTVGEVREGFYSTTGSVSERVRTLSVAGIAIVWALSQGNLTQVGALAQTSIVLLVVALLCDFLQYFVQAFIWDTKLSTFEEGKLAMDREINLSRAWRRPGEVFWILKASFFLAGYVSIAYLVWTQWLHPGP